MVHSRTACSYPSTSNIWLFKPSPLVSEGLVGVWKASRFADARLHAVSSRNMYSEHGLEATIGPDAEQVCQSLIVVWNCSPGSALAQAAWPIFSHRSRAFTVFAILPGLVRQNRSQSRSASTAFKNSSVTRTVLLEFWPETVR